MPPFIYRLRDPNFSNRYTVPEGKIEVSYQSQVPRKLFSLGHGREMAGLRLGELCDDPHYHESLELSYDPSAPQSLIYQAKEVLGDVSRSWLILWEVLTTFGLLANSPSIYSNEPEMISSLQKTYEKSEGKKTSKKTSTSKGASFDQVVFQYSQIELDEMVAVQVLLQELPNLLLKLRKGGDLVVQIFGIKTQIMLDLTWLLSCYFEEAYFIKPSAVSSIYNESYLVFQGLISSNHLSFEKVDLMYPSRLTVANLPLVLHENFQSNIKCLSRTMVELQYHQFSISWSYVQNKIYDGNTRDPYIQSQEDQAKIWLATYSKPDPDRRLLSDLTENSVTLCASHLRTLDEMVESVLS